jgi:hypothetical protein
VARKSKNDPLAVDVYLATLPRAECESLEALRTLIKDAREGQGFKRQRGGGERGEGRHPVRGGRHDQQDSAHHLEHAERAPSAARERAVPNLVRNLVEHEHFVRPPARQGSARAIWRIHKKAFIGQAPPPSAPWRRGGVSIPSCLAYSAFSRCVSLEKRAIVERLANAEGQE